MPVNITRAHLNSRVADVRSFREVVTKPEITDAGDRVWNSGIPLRMA
jgi:hypothetical protein